jgi:hypothetical protein
MKKLIVLTLLVLSAAFVSLAQSKGHETVRTKADEAAIREQRQEEQRELKELKLGTQAADSLVPADFNDTDSFGQNVKFLGSLYAGTLYVYKSCDPAVLLADLGLVLAPDDHCAVHDYATVNGPRMPTTTVFDPVWQITIPKNTISNVVYPLLNNGIAYDAINGIGGPASVVYTPRLTIESDALNDPAAVDSNGNPLNGSLTVSLTGSRVKNFSIIPGEFITDIDNYASVAGRGLSRVYFRSIGLPNSVINNLFKKDMTLKFGIRARITGPIDYANFFYTFRLMGQ